MFSIIIIQGEPTVGFLVESEAEAEVRRLCRPLLINEVAPR